MDFQSIFIAFAFTTQPGASAADTAKLPDHYAQANATAQALSIVNNVQPQTLLLRKRGDGTNECVSVVIVNDPAEACKMYHCVKVFPSESIKELRKGARALLARPCQETAGTTGQVLWGSDGVLALQTTRTGAGLWTQASSKGMPAIRLETEASSGLLSYSGSKLLWVEEPN